MIKKLLFIFFLATLTNVFSQVKTIDKLTAVPNPFTISTNITFNADKDTKVIFSVKNVLGKTVHKEVIKAKTGKNTIPFSKGDLSTGVYIYSIQNEKNNISKRLVIK